MGDVFWAPNPFRPGSNPRLWVVLAAESLSYRGEEYICAALTTSDLPENVEIGEGWLAGNDPSKTSYCSPWVVATIKHDAVANPQGEGTQAFAEQMSSRCREYLEAG